MRIPDSIWGSIDVADTLEDLGTVYWQDIFQWKSDTEETYAYIYEDAYRRFPASAAVSIADPWLKTRLTEEIRRRYSVDPNKALADALRKAAPAVSAALTKPTRSNLRPSILEALNNSRTAPEDLKPALLFAADRLANAYVATLPHRFPAGSAQLRLLIQAGVGFENNELTAVLRTTPVLLQALIERYPDSLWADFASVALLDRWGDCETNGPDAFRRMIDDGTRWLAAHPRSPNQVQVMFTVAAAYETWWSLSRAGADSLVQREDYVEGAEAARQHAIDWYKQAEWALPPDSDGAFAARRKIARLTLKLDTGQRAYSCHGGG